jgi:hypothetical protein
MNTHKQELLPSVVRWAKTQGYENIKANLDGYTKPKTYKREVDADDFTPDATGFNFSEKSYFEIIFKTDSPLRLITKLKLLSQLAAINAGKLFVIAPKGHVSFAQKLVNTNNITATVIRADAIS